MEDQLCQEVILPSFELKKTNIIRKVCFAIIILSTIPGIFYSLLGRYDYLFLIAINYIGGGVSLYLLQQKRLDAAKLWLITAFTFSIMLSTFLLDTASYASFMIIPVLFAAMLFYQEQRYLWHCILMAIIGFLICEGIIFYTEPIFDSTFPFIHKFFSGLAVILVTYLLLDLFKVEILKKEATLLTQNVLLKNEIEAGKRVETNLVAKEKHLKLVLETANLAVRDLNVKTGEIVVDDQYACLFEYDKELFLSGDLKLIYLVHEADKPAIRSLINKQLNGSISNYKAIFRVYTKSGKIKRIQQVSKTITIDNDGKPKRILQLCMNITAQSG